MKRPADLDAMSALMAEDPEEDDESSAEMDAEGPSDDESKGGDPVAMLSDIQAKLEKLRSMLE